MVLVLRRHTPKYPPGQDPLRHLAEQSAPEPTGSEEAPPLKKTPEEKAPVPTRKVSGSSTPRTWPPPRRPRTRIAYARGWSSATDENLLRRVDYQNRQRSGNWDSWAYQNRGASSDEFLSAFGLAEEALSLDGFMAYAGRVLAVHKVYRGSRGLVEEWAYRETGNYQADLLRRAIEAAAWKYRYSLADVTAALYIEMAKPHRQLFIEKNITGKSDYTQAFDRCKGWLVSDAMRTVRRQAGQWLEPGTWIDPDDPEGKKVQRAVKIVGDMSILEGAPPSDPLARGLSTRRSPIDFASGLGGGDWEEKIYRWWYLGWASDAYRHDPAEIVMRRDEIKLTLDALGASEPRKARDRVARELVAEGIYTKEYLLEFSRLRDAGHINSSTSSSVFIPSQHVTICASDTHYSTEVVVTQAETEPAGSVKKDDGLYEDSQGLTGRESGTRTTREFWSVPMVEIVLFYTEKAASERPDQWQNVYCPFHDPEHREPHKAYAGEHLFHCHKCMDEDQNYDRIEFVALMHDVSEDEARKILREIMEL